MLVLAILRNDPTNPAVDKIVCVCWFRPPVESNTIELPAVLIDPGETVATAAKREFCEETGYIGRRVVNVLPVLYLSPGLTNKSCLLVRLKVDMTLEESVRVREKKMLNKGLEESKRD